MGLRETLNDNPRITTGVTIGIIVVVLAWILWPRGGGVAGGGGGGVATQAYFTTDDGKTYFPDDATKIPPYKKDNKDAVRAIVYKCGGKTFVNHLERYDAATQKRLASAPPGAAVVDAVETGLEVKDPNGKDWVRINDPRAQAIMKPKCDDPSDLEVVRP